MRELLTSEYQQQLKLVHATQKWGNAGKVWVPKVLELISQYKFKRPTVLDYGAGECSFSRVIRRLDPTVWVINYDPGIPGIDTPPEGKFDIVLCTDVLEHVEPEYVDQTLQRLRELTKKAAVLNIACKPARQLLPDGRNAHLTVRPAQWWLSKIERLWREVEVLNTYKNFSLVATT